MASARYRHRVTIRRASNVADGKGAFNRTWTDVAANVPAEVISLSGRESQISNVLQGVSNFSITMRYVSGVVPSDQIKWGSRELNVLNAEDPDGKRRQLVVLASTESPQGA
jgi:SPP1 family predicted phage head-tail adaptor